MKWCWAGSGLRRMTWCFPGDRNEARGCAKEATNTKKPRLQRTCFQHPVTVWTLCFQCHFSDTTEEAALWNAGSLCCFSPFYPRFLFRSYRSRILMDGVFMLCSCFSTNLLWYQTPRCLGSKLAFHGFSQGLQWDKVLISFVPENDNFCCCKWCYSEIWVRRRNLLH